MGILRSQVGAALITALMLTMLALVIALTLLTVVGTGIKVSAGQKRYKSSMTAAQGGVELLTREIMPRIFRGDAYGVLEKEYSLIDLAFPKDDCLRQKLDEPTAKWNKCGTTRTSTDPGQAPDLSFRLSGVAPEKGFSVTSKILDTVPGNSDRNSSEFLDQGDSVTGKDEVIHPQHVPAMYNISVQGVREEEGVREKARLSVLYAY